MDPHPSMTIEHNPNPRMTVEPNPNPRTKYQGCCSKVLQDALARESSLVVQVANQKIVIAEQGNATEHLKLPSQREQVAKRMIEQQLHHTEAERARILEQLSDSVSEYRVAQESLRCEENSHA